MIPSPRSLTKWGGGKAELGAVADSWMRGNPISGDAALKGLIIIARSGMPAGAQVSGPAAQALAVAKATVAEWDHPQAGDSADTLAQLMKGTTHKESDLQRLVQQRVSAVYADGMADAIINDLPQLARGVRDPNDPTKLHPFARVSREDFIMSVRHGDASAYNIVGQKMGVDANTAKRIFSSGVDSNDWKSLWRRRRAIATGSSPSSIRRSKRLRCPRLWLRWMPVIRLHRDSFLPKPTSISLTRLRFRLV
jgi:hypothetical protein